MYCPSCGNESPLEQKFCRHCGFGLEPVNKLISGDADQPDANRRERERLAVRRMFQWISRGCIVLVLGVALLVINRSVIHEPLVQLLSTLLTLAGCSIAVYGVLSPVIRSTYLAGKAADEKRSPQINRQATNELAQPHFPLAIGSVTERTTQLIARDKQD